ncbi:Predicted arabinose efflux permease, MFS family [Flavobacterium swingsii]|jgi:predicted MFS family arabinose efflux permease|uniref:Predicted arabinose efflux permease, MFS family n=1 Tax=Flavobacterium swingsii TaxID=498292 RepID=A0A1I0YQ98_9FLAO|nr:MFS transporter [Flavobacterium swingsii]SFB15555.1 Predicted arabinose efflux permease, MFS family [Flavobacterium swingsii]
MKNYLNAYFDNFRGFSQEVWVLTLITYINRAGAMVMLFLTKYLHDNLFFNLTQIGWMLFCIGVGALFGNWIGGKLTDRLGFYTVMLGSLFLTGFGIISLMFLYDFVEICIGLFLVTAIADTYKPAMYIAVSNFTNKKNRTRALTLVRLAVNLGIVSGPIIAGLVIQKDNYDMLFWIDGLTCIIAISVFMLLIDESKIYKARRKIHRERKLNKVITTNQKIDINFVIFLFASFLTAFLFFQLFTTIPLYNSDKLKLDEFQIGMLLALNGLLIFLFEMPLIGFLERKTFEATKIILLGSVFMTSGFFFLLFSKSVFILVVSIFLITLGQILLFSFSNSFAFTRAVHGQEGKYMAFYAMSFSAAQILSPKIGFSVIENFNYFSNWLLMGVIGLIGIMLYYKLDKNVRFETLAKEV